MFDFREGERKGGRWGERERERERETHRCERKTSVGCLPYTHVLCPDWRLNSLFVYEMMLQPTKLPGQVKTPHKF